MPAISPKYQISTATKAQHLEMLVECLAKTYANANVTDVVNAEFWSNVAGLHGLLAAQTTLPN